MGLHLPLGTPTVAEDVTSLLWLHWKWLYLVKAFSLSNNRIDLRHLTTESTNICYRTWKSTYRNPVKKISSRSWPMINYVLKLASKSFRRIHSSGLWCWNLSIGSSKWDCILGTINTAALEFLPRLQEGNDSSEFLYRVKFLSLISHSSLLGYVREEEPHFQDQSKSIIIWTVRAFRHILRFSEFDGVFNSKEKMSLYLQY